MAAFWAVLFVLVALSFADEQSGIIQVHRLVGQPRETDNAGARLRRKLQDDWKFQSVFRDDGTNIDDWHASESKFKDVVTSRDISTLLKQLRKVGTGVKRGTAHDEFGEYDYVDYKIPKGVSLDYDGFFGDNFDFSEEDKSRGYDMINT